MNKLWFGRFAVCRKACFIGRIYTVNSIAVVEKTFFTKNMLKNVGFRRKLAFVRRLDSSNGIVFICNRPMYEHDASVQSSVGERQGRHLATRASEYAGELAPQS